MFQRPLRLLIAEASGRSGCRCGCWLQTKAAVPAVGCACWLHRQAAVAPVGCRGELPLRLLAAELPLFASCSRLQEWVCCNGDTASRPALAPEFDSEPEWVPGRS